MACTETAPPNQQKLHANTNQPLMLSCADSHAGQVCVGEQGRILYSENGLDWRPADSPAKRLLTTVYFVDPRHGWAAGHDGVILHSTDGGLSWQLQHSAVEEDLPLFDLWFSDRLRGFAVGAFGNLLETHDGGSNWQRRSLAEGVPHLYGIAGRHNSLIIAGEFGTLLRSTDGGRHWNRIGPDGGVSLFGIVQTSDQSWLAYGLNGRLLRSDNDGVSWQEGRLPMATTVQCGSQDRAGSIWLGNSNGRLWRSPGPGDSFQPAGQAPAGLALLLPTKSGLLVGGRFGLRTLSAGIDAGRTKHD